MKSIDYIRDESGVAMIFELLLVAAVVVLGGLAYLNMRSHNAAVPGVATLAPASIVATGSVDNAVNALVQDSISDASSTQTETSNVPNTDIQAGTAQSAAGSLDENSF